MFKDRGARRAVREEATACAQKSIADLQCQCLGK